MSSDPRPVPAPIDPQVCGVCHRVPPSGLCAVCAAESLERHRPNGNAAELDALRLRLAQVEQERDALREELMDEHETFTAFAGHHAATELAWNVDKAKLAALEQAHARLRALALEAGMAPEPNTPEMLDGYIRSVFYALRRTQKELAALQASRTEP